MKILRLLLCAVCVAAAVWLAWLLPQGGRIETDLTALLPQEHMSAAAVRVADEALTQQMNGQIVLLVGSQDGEQAFRHAADTAQMWRDSGLFARLDSGITPDLDDLRTAAKGLGTAVLPREQVQLLYTQPQQYFRELAEAAANPFSGSLLPLDEDWLGVSRFFSGRQAEGHLQWQPDNGMLYTEDQGITWVWLRAVLPEQGADSAQLADLLRRSRTAAAAGGYRFAAAGGALFAAEAKTAAERESTLMSAAGITLTLLLLLSVFRSARALWLLLPPAIGMLTGLAAAVAVFGQIHILTIVIGTSLVGVLVDFPLHWLTPALGDAAWQPQTAMRRVFRGFCISLTVTVSGYVLLWFTPLPVLRQTAVFSAAALLGAFAATVLLLPPLFRHYRAAGGRFARLTGGMVRRLLAPARPKRHALLGLAAVLAVSAGCLKSSWHDDIREWTALPPQLLADTALVGRLSGMQSGGQTVLVQAASPDGLLEADARFVARLQWQGAFGKTLDGVQSLSGWLLSAGEQQALKRRLAQLAEDPQPRRILQETGVPDAAVAQALRDAAAAPDVDLAQSLATPFAEAYRPLYLGRINGKYAALIRLNGVHDTAALAQAVDAQNRAGGAEFYFLDKRAALNREFTHTRNQAAWLKAVSFAAAWLLLWRLFGIRRGSLILAVPAAAALATVAVLGWLNLTVGLFAMFGLLLGAAIGVDYAVYVCTAPESRSARLGGMTLAALTTLISFALLALSSTQAVAVFGITVAAGVLFNWLFAALLLKLPENAHRP